MNNIQPTKEEITKLINTYNLGNDNKAEELALEMTIAFKNFSLGWKVLGATLQRKKKLSEAIYCMEKSIEIDPTDAETYSNLAITYKLNNEFDKAIDNLKLSIKINEKYIAPYCILSNIYKEIGEKKIALYYLLKIYKKNKKNISILNDLGNLYIELGSYNKAEKMFEEALKINSNIAEVYNNIGSLKRYQKKIKEAEFNYIKSIELNPQVAEFYNNLGVLLMDSRRYYEALEKFKKAINLNENYFEAYNNLGSLLKDLGKFNEAVEIYNKAIKLKPTNLMVRSNLIFTLNYIDEISEKEKLKHAINYGVNVELQIKNRFNNWEQANKNTKLKIGLISADFINHPVGYFLESMLNNINKNKIEIIAYSNNPIEDELTLRIKRNIQVWRNIYSKNDEEVAQLIYKDKINILIDLAGHTANNRLKVFAYKPAPIQVTWLGYFSTTGIKEIDYILGDPYVTPYGEAHHYVEKIWQMPETYLCFSPPNENIVIENLPAIKNEFITFGCFNNTSKINIKVIELWSKILNLVNNSKIFLKAKQLSDEEVKNQILKSFEKFKIKSNRIILEGYTNRADYFASYNRVDIALDPFPYPGGTTSVEGLWMGVPVITKKGHHFISHNGETIAMNSGQSMWIANDDDEYIKKAKYFASDLCLLSKIRSEMRSKIIVSPLMDAKKFARNFEESIQNMWLEKRTSK
jgi:protein O-GlcNAc transferase